MISPARNTTLNNLYPVRHAGREYLGTIDPDNCRKVSGSVDYRTIVWFYRTAVMNWRELLRDRL